MKKILGSVFLCLLAAALVLTGALLAERQMMDSQLLHFSVETNQDSAEDARLRESVLNAVLAELSSDIQNVGDFGKAADYMKEKLPILRKTIDGVLQAADYGGTVLIQLSRECFPGGSMDMRAIPAGVYETLRIILSEEKDKASAEGSGSLEAFAPVGTYDEGASWLSALPFDAERLRFWALNLLGKAENLLLQ